MSMLPINDARCGDNVTTRINFIICNNPIAEIQFLNFWTKAILDFLNVRIINNAISVPHGHSDKIFCTHYAKDRTVV